MNRSWKNNSNNSPGFVYFNQSNLNQNHQSDTADFLSFGDNPAANKSPNFKRFSPSHYSSPEKYQKRSPKNFNTRNSYHYSGGGQYSNSYNSPSNSYNSYNNSYNSYNNSYNRRSGQQVKNKRNFNKYVNKADKSDTRKNISKFYDHTCLKDPWAELVKSLEKQQEAEAEKDAIDASEKEQSEAKEEEVKGEGSPSESDDQDSDSESKSSSSSTPDEETT